MAAVTDTKINEPRNNKILLEETFYVLTKKNSVFRVRLTPLGLNLIKECDNQFKTQTIPITDIIGCRCLRSKKQGNPCACRSLPHTSTLKVVDEKSGEHDDSDASAYLYIYAYILQNHNVKRERTTITLRFRSFDRYEDNYKEAQRWRTVLKKLMRCDDVSDLNIAEFGSLGRVKENRRLLVLLNPKSGSGKGRAIFQKKIIPVLQEAEIPYDLHVTKYANYAREFIRTCNIFQWTGVLMVGGDGILFEVINGMFERWDWSQALKHLPVGIIPGGSGNGLARSIAHECNEPYHSPTLPAALAAVRNHQAPMDLVRVETTSQIMFSFLSIGWGFLSDVDIESEMLRMIGEPRFTIWSVAKLVGLKCYSGKVFYLPADQEAGPNNPRKSTESTNEDNNTNFEIPKEVQLETQAGRQRLDSWYSAASRRSAYFSATGSSYQSTAGSTGDGARDSESKPRMYGPASKIPCLTAKVLPNWECIEGSFVMVHAVYQSHISKDLFFAPQAKLSDGVIWLLIVHASASRTQLFNFLLGLSSGAHANVPETGGVIEMRRVIAFRIEPDPSEQGNITVDGELVEYGPIQAEMFPGLGKVMVP